MKILIVDDDPLVCRPLRIALTCAGHKVLEAPDGQAAWELLQRESVRFVIVDWMLPEGDGPELVRRIRASDFPGYTYIVLLIPKDGRDDVIVDGLEAGADDYLAKPIDPGELRARVTIGEHVLDLETRLSEALDQLQILATRDNLTGLLNRRAIYEHAEAELSRARREAKPMSLMLLAVDKFKAVNDQHGRLAGDHALRLVAETIARNRRRYDWVGRWDGEEFLVVLPGTALPEAGSVAERLRVSVAAAPFPLSDGSYLELRVSAGVAGASSENLPELEVLLQQADEALSRAKRKGGNQVSLFNQ